MDLGIALAVVLVSIISFQGGKAYMLSQISHSVKIDSAPASDVFNTANTIGNTQSANISSGGGSSDHLDFRVVVSKSSTTKKYHFLWCAGANQISETNKIYFNSDKEAITAGYTLAGNCKK
ncbi:MAG: hypothetical protein A3F25_00860 [Candidatus Yanofskybacteria bacterium RIFCSPHIGHO2_12_FULL_45_19b]|uniref:Uncharacterized protein n=1 Tax=Candidatus Yanofskybacteria bacterium RIFCSPHIGHO2_12_FULL_45_19b TaxID=1802689 RepID=A0A1F8G739_9BACT|nr:MAG: hypothetical protein A3F25_00860 [Candidatus Yanofskybacteria bacterium RIFCSPHIGHO2_12_FULL_45_19b]